MELDAIEFEFHGFFSDYIYYVKYIFLTILDGAYVNSDDNFKDDFTKDGCVIFRDCVTKFYTPEFYCALTFGYFLRMDYETNSTKDDHIEFIKCYIDAFKDGKQEFNNEIRDAGINGTQERVSYLQGWLKKCEFILYNPEFLMYHIVKAYGYYAGIFSRIIELIDNDRRLHPHIKEIANNDPELQQRIEKLVDFKQPKQPAPDTQNQGDDENNNKNPIFETTYTSKQLEKIFDSLVNKRVTKAKDKEHFLSIFSGNFSGKTFWNSSIRGAKAALFDLVERLTERQYTTAEILKAFNCEKLHDHNKPQKHTKMIDEVMK